MYNLYVHVYTCLYERANACSFYKQNWRPGLGWMWGLNHKFSCMSWTQHENYSTRLQRKIECLLYTVCLFIIFYLSYLWSAFLTQNQGGLQSVYCSLNSSCVNGTTHMMNNAVLCRSTQNSTEVSLMGLALRDVFLGLLCSWGNIL